MKLALIRRRTVAWVLLFTYLPGCTSWRAVGPTPAEYLQKQRPGEIQVTRTDNSQVKLRAPALVGDTLVGTVGGGLALRDTTHPISISLGEVRTLEVRKFSIGKTVGLYLAVGLGVMIICASGGQPAPSC